MSISFSDSLASATRYNTRSIRRLNLFNALPAKFKEEYDLSDTPSAEDLSVATQKYQEQHGLTKDGKLGPGTLRHILKNDRPQLTSRYWTYNIARSNPHDGLNLVGYDEPKGLGLHSVGYFTPRWFINRTPTQVVVHWGGLNPHHLYNCFSGARKVSSHVGIGLVDDEACAYQYLNLMHKAWHAGKANSRSLGIDICQQPTVRWLDHYTQRGYTVEKIDNPSTRGDKECLSLDPRILEQTRLVISDLCYMFGIPLQTPETEGVLSDHSNFKGVLGHHHISKKKWDCAPWWDDISSGLLRKT